MFSKEALTLLKEVILSWQVIAVTIALILYLNIVFYAARARRRVKLNLRNKINFKRKKPKVESEAVETEELTESNQTDELGLEEA